MHDKQRQTVDKRITRNKTKAIEALKKSPVIQIACDRAGISRATFFRWKAEDEDFARELDKALSEGKGFISDMAIAQLIRAVKDGNTTLIKFWLTKHHPDYKDKLDINAEIKQETMVYTPEQKQFIKHALEMLASANVTTQNHEQRNTTDHRNDGEGSSDS